MGSLELWTALVIRRTRHTSHFRRMSYRRSFTLVWKSRWVTETRRTSWSKSSIPRKNEAHSRCWRMVTTGIRTGTNRRTRLITFTAMNARVTTGKFSLWKIIRFGICFLQRRAVCRDGTRRGEGITGRIETCTSLQFPEPILQIF